MGLRQVNTGSADFFPQVGDGIQPDEIGALSHVKQQNINDVEQHRRVFVVEVNLIGAERCPDVLATGGGFKWGEQRQGAGSGDAAQIGIGRHGDEIIPVGRVILQKGLKPVALRRHVIDDRIEHQPEVLAERGQVGPIAHHRVHRGIIYNAEPVVGRIRIKGQQMHRADDAPQPALYKLGQAQKCGVARLPDLVAVGDEDGVGLGDALGGRRRGRSRVQGRVIAAKGIEAVQQVEKNLIGGFRPVYKCQMGL